MKFTIFIATLMSFIIFGCSLFSSKNYPPLDVVASVDINKYVGMWYEIASLPVSQQKGCYCTTAEYSIIDNETIKVVNRCRKDSINGEFDEAEGKAFVVEGSNNAKLKVQFFWPFKGDYWIINLDKDYKYAVVGVPSRKYFWILSREPKMDKELLNSLLNNVKEKGFDISTAQKTINCEKMQIFPGQI
jgi:apolipoprotein D and lipocalin family protein